MKRLKSLLASVLILLGGSSMAETTSVSTTEFSLEFRLWGGVLDLRINDIPVFGVGDPLDAQTSINSSFPLNAFVQNGLNTVTVDFEAHPEPLVDTSLHLRFGYNSSAIFPELFSDLPFAADVKIPGSSESHYDYVAAAMPSMIGLNDATYDNGTLTFTLEVDSDRSAPLWLGGEPLTANDATRNALIAQTRLAHAAIENGADAARDVLGPMLAYNGEAFGESADAIFEFDYAFLSDPSLGFELQPFDSEASEVRIFGDGRIAILVPSPVVVISEAENQQIRLTLYYWKDETGTWRIIQ